MKPSLIILAAGMGSRYGGLKQLDQFGPNGEAIIDYSLYDALAAGFGKIVFIIRDSFKADMVKAFAHKLDGKVEYHFVNQDLSTVPPGIPIHPERTKPWGTAHAVWVARDVISEPFGVINADDFYGAEAYQTLADFLSPLEAADTRSYCTVGYYLRNTLSDHGTVNRGICSVDENNNLVAVHERTKIKRFPDGIIRYDSESADPKPLNDEDFASMNMWGCVPNYFKVMDVHFKSFLEENGMDPKSEYYIPTLIDYMIAKDLASVNVLPSESTWFGVTYPEDKPAVMASLSKLIDSGAYPSDLWS
ncbi:MAG: sugar phosphate nucleotidyltransferase [Saprospiraceae bacterium]|nr:sugar phosphate nucleotidyltransferase [Saprospiraceae bacterium]